MSDLPPFHYAFLVDNLDAARHFYIDVLGCQEGRSSEQWIDFNFFGHQIVAHLSQQAAKRDQNRVDGHDVPVPHFGVVLDWENWTFLAENLSQKGLKFEIEPYIRFKGQVGEQGTMFFRDPAGNAIEIKTFKDPDNLFAR